MKINLLVIVPVIVAKFRDLLGKQFQNLMITQHKADLE